VGWGAVEGCCETCGCVRVGERSEQRGRERTDNARLERGEELELREPVSCICGHGVVDIDGVFDILGCGQVIVVGGECGCLFV
jgi:hypothetical protein